MRFCCCVLHTTIFLCISDWVVPSFLSHTTTHGSATTLPFTFHAFGCHRYFTTARFYCRCCTPPFSFSLALFYLSHAVSPRRTLRSLRSFPGHRTHGRSRVLRYYGTFSWTLLRFTQNSAVACCAATTHLVFTARFCLSHGTVSLHFTRSRTFTFGSHFFSVHVVLVPAVLFATPI